MYNVLKVFRGISRIIESIEEVQRWKAVVALKFGMCLAFEQRYVIALQ